MLRPLLRLQTTGYHHNNTTLRCFPVGYRRTLLTEVFSAAREILRGDDHINPKKLLERRYLYNALVACSFREARFRTPDTDPKILLDETFQKLEEQNLDAIPNVDLRQELQLLLNPQIRDMFQCLHKVDTDLGVPFGADQVLDEGKKGLFLDVLEEELERVRHQLQTSPSSSFFATKRSALETLLQFHGTGGSSEKIAPNEIQNGLDPFGMVPEPGSRKLDLIRQHQTVNICRAALIRRELGFSVLCLRSGIAGRGLFIDGNALSGALVALQPGDVWPKEHLLTTAPDVMEHFAGDDDCHISLRFDDYVLDSRAAPVTVLSQEGSMNPFSVAHMANHPLAGTLPTCQSTMFNYTATNFQKNNLGAAYIPNSYARTPTWQSRFFDREETLMHGLGLLARRDVRDEELTYDYRLQSDETPEWYSVVQYGDGLENEQVVFFRDDWKNKA